MNRHPCRERGAVLVVGLIMLVLITIVLIGAFVYSTSNSRAVGNQQFHAEALAAANHAIEQVISSPFTDSPAAEDITIDINNDGRNEYSVHIDAPTCLTYLPIAQTATDPSSVTLGAGFTVSISNFVMTEWNIHATATDIASGSGTSVEVNQGVRVQLTQAQATAACP